MQTIDAFWLFITDAILNTDNKLIFLYNKLEDYLVRGNLIGSVYEPKYFNPSLKLIDDEYRIEVKSKFDEALKKFELKNVDLIILKSINRNEVSSFIDSYLRAIDNIDYYDKIKDSISSESLHRNSVFISKINMQESFRYDSLFGKFIREKFDEEYSKYGINFNTKVYW